MRIQGLSTVRDEADPVENGQSSSLQPASFVAARHAVPNSTNFRPTQWVVATRDDIPQLIGAQAVLIDTVLLSVRFRRRFSFLDSVKPNDNVTET
jgi:hypothetical protein